MAVAQKTAEQFNVAKMNNALKRGIEQVVTFINSAPGTIAGGNTLPRYGGCKLGSDLRHANLVEIDKKAGKYALMFYPSVPLSKEEFHFERLQRFPQKRRVLNLVYYFELGKPAAGKLKDHGEGVPGISPLDVGKKLVGDIYFSYKPSDLIKWFTVPGVTRDPKKEFSRNYQTTTIHLTGDPFGKNLNVAISKSIIRSK
jgi:hypothetical protein